ncbi:hypothetical protein [Streptomyces apricus]|uniref:Uncharacterized protein n=1 Tax=Streptomyces apricus TaxID=1828112 RepID=A0A5B0ANU0_9ACTN|nr:hypothetical protein [Streptomyces apricus]KAA0931454.1 hypothetical protein FGF04_21145 [Streptomyces apricus]
MHTYDAPRRLSPSSPIPAVRSAQDTPGGPSATPIYDALYAEYLRTFRALPGDRSGEEEFGLAVLGGPYGTGAHAPAAYGVRHGAGQYRTGYASAYDGHPVTSVWQPVARQHTTGLTPAALPPAPRRAH